MCERHFGVCTTQTFLSGEVQVAQRGCAMTEREFPERPYRR